MKRLTALLLIMSAFALSGCSRISRLYLQNNTGLVIEILHASVDEDPWTSELFVEEGERYRIRNRSGRELLGIETGSRVLIAVGECRAIYQFPPVETMNSRYDVVVRLERDLRVFLINPNHHVRWHAPAWTNTPAQQAGFPISPVDVARCAWNPGPESAFIDPNDGS